MYWYWDFEKIQPNFDDIFRAFDRNKYVVKKFSSFIRFTMFLDFSESVCTTESGPTPGLPCIFPFKVDGFAYHTCKLDEKDGSRWCSTKIDENGQHLQGNWGNCRSDCGE